MMRRFAPFFAPFCSSSILARQPPPSGIATATRIATIRAKPRMSTARYRSHPAARSGSRPSPARVNITGSSGNQVVIKAVRRATRERLDDIKLEITQSGNVIDIDANHRVVERRNDNVVETDFDIQVPGQVKLDLRTFSAPVTVNSVAGDLVVEGFSSEIRLDGRLRTEAGEDVQRRRQRAGTEVGRRRRPERQHVQRRRDAAAPDQRAR